MTDLVAYVFDDHHLRAAKVGLRPYFVGKDVAVCLAYDNPPKAVRDHCRHAVRWADLVSERVGVQPTAGDSKVNDTFTFGEGKGNESFPLPDRGSRNFDVRASIGLDDGSARQDEAAEGGELLRLHPHTLMIPQGDLMRLIVKSRLPAAERFERLVFDVILPTILETGSWGPPPSPAAPDPDRTAAALALIREIRLTHGIRAARAMWTDVGLPAVPDVFDIPEDGAGARAHDAGLASVVETVREFMDECCMEDRLGRVQAAEFYSAYCKWATARKAEIMSNNKFGRSALKIGLKRVDGARRIYYGVRLRAEVLRQFEPKAPTS